MTFAQFFFRFHLLKVSLDKGTLTIYNEHPKCQTPGFLGSWPIILKDKKIFLAFVIFYEAAKLSSANKSTRNFLERFFLKNHLIK